MNEHIPESAIGTLRGWAAGRPEIARIHVFGSRVRGINKDGGPVRADSDLDVAIELTLPADEQFGFWFHAWKDWLTEIAPLMPFPIHLQLLDGDCENVSAFVEAGGALIYEREGD